MLNALVGLFLFSFDLPVGSFVINAVEKCAEGNESQIEEEEDEYVDECYPIDEVLDSFG